MNLVKAINFIDIEYKLAENVQRLYAEDDLCFESKRLLSLRLLELNEKACHYNR